MADNDGSQWKPPPIVPSRTPDRSVCLTQPSPRAICFVSKRICRFRRAHQSDEHVPPLDPDYVFDRDTTLALLAGFMHNRRVMVQGRHGTGKSSHVEQVARG